METFENERLVVTNPQTLVLSRQDVKDILTEWDRRAKEGDWDKSQPFDADTSADLFIEIAFKI